VNSLSVSTNPFSELALAKTQGRLSTAPIAEKALAPAANEADSVAEGSEASKQRARLKKATQDFEAVFIGMMLKQMRKTMAGENPLFSKNSEAKYYQEMMDDAVAQQMSRTGQFGLGEMLYKKVEKTLPPDPDTLARHALNLQP
jgi:Rod binding domain-containing protein